MYANFSCFSSLDVLLLQTLRSLKDPTSMPYLEMSLPVRSGSHPPGTQNPTAMRGGGVWLMWAGAGCSLWEGERKLTFGDHQPQIKHPMKALRYMLLSNPLVAGVLLGSAHKIFAV